MLIYRKFVTLTPELIPHEVIERELTRFSKNEDWLQRARFYKSLGKTREAVSDYIVGINESLQDNRYFSTAYYLKEFMKDGLLEELFILALKQASDEGDLWWQIRSLQELGWHKELNEFVLRNADEIEKSDNPMMILLLASAKGDRKKCAEIRKNMAQIEHIGEIVFHEEDDDDEEIDS